MQCALIGADRYGLLVTPLECSISRDGGSKVYYPNAGINLTERFDILGAERPDLVFPDVNKAAVHLLSGLLVVHNKVSTLPVGGMCLTQCAAHGQESCALVVLLHMRHQNSHCWLVMMPHHWPLTPHRGTATADSHKFACRASHAQHMLLLPQRPSSHCGCDSLVSSTAGHSQLDACAGYVCHTTVLTRACILTTLYLQRLVLRDFTEADQRALPA
jgi:hypothetical protein